MNFTPVLATTKCGNESSPKVFKSMINKNKKQKSDAYKYAYVNTEWWNNFNDSTLTGYINRAIQHNYDLKMATLAVEEYYQNTKIQFANELPTVGAGFAPAYTTMPGTRKWDWSFATPAYVNYEADIFLKNRDKTKSVKKLYEASQLDERAAHISVAGAVGSVYYNIVKADKLIENII